jgi:hypothetical protein
MLNLHEFRDALLPVNHRRLIASTRNVKADRMAGDRYRRIATVSFCSMMESYEMRIATIEVCCTNIVYDDDPACKGICSPVIAGG